MKKQLTESDKLRKHALDAIAEATKAINYKHTPRKPTTPNYKPIPEQSALCPAQAFSVWLDQDRKVNQLLIRALARAYDAGVVCGKALATANKARRK